LLSIALSLVAWAATIITSNVVNVGDRLPMDLFEFGLFGALCWQLYRGRPWARWLMVAFLGLGVLGSAVLIAMGHLSYMVGLPYSAYLITVVILVFGPGVGHYFSPYGMRFRHEALGKSDPQAELVSRPLDPKERPLVEHLLAKAGMQLDVDSLRVSSRDEAGKGRLRFEAHSLNPKLASTPVDYEFTDSDGVQVSATLGLDQRGDPFELDVWKVDFSALEQWPSVDSFAE